MKRIGFFFAGLLLTIFVGCSGSKTYRGTWKAIDANGQKCEIIFDATTFTIKDSTGGTKHYDYTQNSVAINNSVSTYGIKLQDGRGYQINFPNSSNETVGLIKDENGGLIYTISRTDYVKYDDIYKL